MESFRLKSARFRAERAESWQELEGLLDRIERHGTSGLSSDELSRLPTLYRSAASALSVARSVSLDRNLLEYLESLVGRAYFAVYARPRSPAEGLLRFAVHDFPHAVRQFRRFIALAALVLIVGEFVGAILILRDPNQFHSIVPDAFAQGRGPAATTEELRDVLYGSENESAELSVFASTLFNNNAGVGILAFGLGFVAAAPTLYLLFYNGILLGAFVGLYQGRGLGLDFWGWILPHGITELLAVVLCGGAGIAVGMALVFPHERGRLHGLAERGRQAAMIVAGSVMMFFLAALIEGFFRQLVDNIVVRFGVATLTAIFWTLYLGYSGRDATAWEDDLERAD